MLAGPLSSFKNVLKGRRMGYHLYRMGSSDWQIGPVTCGGRFASGSVVCTVPSQSVMLLCLGRESHTTTELVENLVASFSLSGCLVGNSQGTGTN